jgi:hypothetical protein
LLESDFLLWLEDGGFCTFLLYSFGSFFYSFLVCLLFLLLLDLDLDVSEEEDLDYEEEDVERFLFLLALKCGLKRRIRFVI